MAAFLLFDRWCRNCTHKQARHRCRACRRWTCSHYAGFVCTFCMNDAKDACYWRLHPEPSIDTSVGARRLYDAVCDLWNYNGAVARARAAQIAEAQ